MCVGGGGVHVWSWCYVSLVLQSSNRKRELVALLILSLNSLTPEKFFMLCKKDFRLLILKNHFFLKKSFRNTITVSNRLDPDQAQQNVRPDLGSNCLQK